MNPKPMKTRQIPLYLILVASLAAVAIFFRLQQAGTASANTGDIQLAESTYPNIVGSRIDTCVLCHTSSIPNMNPYGAAYLAAGRGLASSLHAIENVDSDGDGFTNIQEIMALTFPGNAADHPAAFTATSTPFQPPTSTPTRTMTSTQVAATATSTSTRMATATRAITATSIVVTTAAPSATATLQSTVRASLTPTVKPTLGTSVTPTCISPTDDDENESEDVGEKDDCSHHPKLGESNKQGQNKSGSGNEDARGRSAQRSNQAGQPDSITSFLNSLFARLAGRSD